MPLGETPISTDSGGRAFFLHPALTHVLIWLVGAVPAIFLTMTVVRYGVNVPARDDWEMAPLIVQAHRGELHWADLFAQQQEARTLVPKLIFILFAFRGHWDVREQMMLSIGFCVLTAAGLYFLLRRTGLSLRATAICFWLSMLLVFAPSQFELWIFASGFPSYMPILYLVAGLAAMETKWAMGSKFALCAVLSILSSFTLPHGLLAWALIFPVGLLAYPNSRWKRWMVAWSILTAVISVIYFYDYTKPADLPEFAPRVPILDYLKFGFAFLGGEFAFATHTNHVRVAFLTGVVVLALYLAALYYAFRQRISHQWPRRAAPWFAIGFYSLGSAVLATLGRVGFGVAYSNSSRYVTFSIYSTVAVIVLLALILSGPGSEWTVRWRRRAAIASCVLLGIGFALYWTSFTRTLAFLRGESARDSLEHTGVLFSLVLDTARAIEPFNYPSIETVRARALELDKLGLVRPPLVKTTEIKALNPVEGGADSGTCEKIEPLQDQKFRASGWAILPNKHRQSDGVLLAYENPEKGWIAFALSDQLIFRRDISRKMRRPDLVWSGWSATFPRDAVPPGARISAWAVEADGPTLYRLSEGGENSIKWEGDENPSPSS